MNIIYYASRNRNSRVVGANSAPLSLYKNAPVDGVSIEPVSVLIPLTRLSAHPTRDKVFLLRAVASMNLGTKPAPPHMLTAPHPCWCFCYWCLKSVGGVVSFCYWWNNQRRFDGSSGGLPLKTIIKLFFE